MTDYRRNFSDGNRRPNQNDTFIVGEITEEDGKKRKTMINMKWLCGDKCYWPHYMKPEKVIEGVLLYGKPDDKWKKIPFRGLQFFSSFFEGREILNTLLLEESSHSPQETENIVRQDELMDEGLSQSSNVANVENIQEGSTIKDNVSQEEILSILRKQQAEIDALKKEVNDLKSALSEKNSLLPLMTLVTSLPMSSVNQIERFNEILSVKDIFEKVSSVLKNIEKANADVIVGRLLMKVLTKNVAESYDWTGFSKLRNITKLLTAAAQYQHCDMTEHDVQTHLKTWLKKIKEKS